jgi:hypothetical protein
MHLFIHDRFNPALVAFLAVAILALDKLGTEWVQTVSRWQASFAAAAFGRALSVTSARRWRKQCS